MLLLSEPTALPPQPDGLHHPVVVRENATTGDGELLPQDKRFSAAFSVLLPQFGFIQGSCLGLQALWLSSWLL